MRWASWWRTASEGAGGDGEKGWPQEAHNLQCDKGKYGFSLAAGANGSNCLSVEAGASVQVRGWL